MDEQISFRESDFEGEHGNWDCFHKEPKRRRVDDETMAEYLRKYEQYRKTLLKMATHAREKAVSYREVPFKVGSAILTVDSEEKFRVDASHNWTPTKRNREGGEKRCAERNTIDAALLADGEAFIVAITTVSHERDTGDGSSAAHGVLHPCPECRKLLRQMIAQGHLSEKSVLCSVNDSSDKPEPIVLAVEEKTVGEVLALYKDEENQPQRLAA